MAKEAFLIGNPPKRAPKKKKANTGLKRHRILAFEGKGGGMFTSGAAKIVRPGIKINPFRKNPLFGEELMFIGANPQRKAGEKHMAKKRTHHKKFKRSSAKRHRSFRMNPVAYMNMGLAKGVGGAVAGAVAARMVPNLLKFSGWQGNLLQAVVGIAGLVFGSKLDKEFGTGVALGAAAILGTDLTAGMLAGASTAVATTVQGYDYAQPALAGPYTDDPYSTPAVGGYEVAY